MIKNVILASLILIIIICSCKEKDENYNLRAINYSSKIVLPGHFVPDTNTAIKIAEAIWLIHYGDYVLKERPYEVKLELGLDTIWHIKGTAYFSEDPNLLSFGSLAYISIRSKDCRIIELNHSE